MCDSLPQIQRHIFAFYKNLFGSKSITNVRLMDNFWDEPFYTSHNDSQTLELLFTEQELRKAILSLMHQEPLALMGLAFYSTNIFLI
jgi:hypothetical protein